MVQKPRLEKDGLYIEDSENWQMWETTFQKYAYTVQKTYTIKSGEKRCYKDITFHHKINIPVGIIRYLKLKKGDKIMVAIRKAEKVKK